MAFAIAVANRSGEPIPLLREKGAASINFWEFNNQSSVGSRQVRT